MNPRDWPDTPSCLGVDADMFFPDGRTLAIVQKLCAGCPVRLHCLEYALEVEVDTPRNYRYGIYGGMTAEQRARLAARRAA